MVSEIAVSASSSLRAIEDQTMDGGPDYLARCGVGGKGKPLPTRGGARERRQNRRHLRRRAMEPESGYVTQHRIHSKTIEHLGTESAQISPAQRSTALNGQMAAKYGMKGI